MLNEAQLTVLEYCLFLESLKEKITLFFEYVNGRIFFLISLKVYSLINLKYNTIISWHRYYLIVTIFQRTTLNLMDPMITPEGYGLTKTGFSNCFTQSASAPLIHNRISCRIQFSLFNQVIKWKLLSRYDSRFD
jgi:hypothetical protein